MNNVIHAVKNFGRPIKPYLRILRSGFYSQYGEDALLFIAAKPSRRGFYVDIGAYHPIDGSNTFKLYLQGWRGLTVEPNPRIEALFRTLRPRDTHVVCGVSQEPSQLEYFEFSIPMLNTMSAERAALLSSEGYQLVRKRNVGTMPLPELLSRHAPGKHIDLLSVDCEGFDLEVLSTLDFDQNRPTIVIIEDFDQLTKLKSGLGNSEIENFMRNKSYVPMSQAFYSTIYVAKDWKDLNRRSNAFDVRTIQPGLLPS